MLSSIKRLMSKREKRMDVVENLDISIGMPKTVQRVVDGVIVTDVEFVTDYNDHSQFKVSDFALQNLLAAGVKMNQVPGVDPGRLAIADSAIKGVESIKYKNNGK